MSATSTDQPLRLSDPPRPMDDPAAQAYDAWNSVARGWGDRANAVDHDRANVTRRMLELTAPRRGERVLELGCGAAGVGLAAAALVGPEGEVVISDVACEMTAIAAARARASKIGNVSVCELDLERIAQPDESYDVVLCRDGLMFALDPARALREVRRVLRPGGRVSVAVHGQRDLNPWLSVPLDAVSAEVVPAACPRGLPGPFSLSDPDRLIRLFADAGLCDIVIGEVAITVHEDSYETWWATVSSCAPPLARMVATLPAHTIRALLSCLEEASRVYRTADGLELPGVSLVAAGVWS